MIGTASITPIPQIVVTGETLFPNQVAGAVVLYKVRGIFGIVDEVVCYISITDEFHLEFQ